MAFRIAHLPIRLAAGAYILNSGLGKRGADADTAAYLHGAASRVLPTVRDMPPEQFAKVLSNSEIALGSALLLPFVPSALVGAALTGFGVSLMGHYFTEPDTRMEDGIRPSPQGIGLAKDVWLVGMGLTLLVDGMRPPCPVR